MRRIRATSCPKETAQAHHPKAQPRLCHLMPGIQSNRRLGSSCLNPAKGGPRVALVLISSCAR